MANQFAGLGHKALWFVTRPTPDSCIEDIVFKIGTWRDLTYQFNGGLDPDEIDNTFFTEKAARARGLYLLAAYRGRVGGEDE